MQPTSWNLHLSNRENKLTWVIKLGKIKATNEEDWTKNYERPESLNHEKKEKKKTYLSTLGMTSEWEIEHEKMTNIASIAAALVLVLLQP